MWVYTNLGSSGIPSIAMSLRHWKGAVLILGFFHVRMLYAYHTSVRNVNLFYLLAEQISKRPPRGHRLDSHMSKLHQYVRKFDDLHRRLLVRCPSASYRTQANWLFKYFHDRVDILKLRSKLNASKRRAQEQKQTERERRRIFNTAFEEGRARRHELREELREVYRVRASRFLPGVGRGTPPPGWF